MPDRILRGPLDGLETETYPVISTAHIAQSDAELLDQLVDDVEETGAELPDGILHIAPLWSSKRDPDGSVERFGWRIKHQSDAGDDGLRDRMRRVLWDRNFTSQFIDIIDALILSTYAGVVIDRDGPQYDHLPEFDW